MNVIFLDVDGVLNYKKFEDEYLRSFHYNYENEILNVDIEKFKLLAKICKQYNCKVVLSSSWKMSYSYYEGLTTGLYKLITMFYEEGIDFLGFTPCIPNEDRAHGQEMWKEWDIKCYLYEHPEVEHYCVFDDEMYDLETIKDFVIQTKYDELDGDGGIMEHHVEEVGKILEKRITR